MLDLMLHARAEWLDKGGVARYPTKQKRLPCFMKMERLSWNLQKNRMIR
jgi:hypothetical protein